MLKAKLDNLDGVSDEIKEHYVERDGKFYLDVSKVDGLAVEDVTGLKSTVEKLRTKERELTQALKSANDEITNLSDKYKDIDPVAAKSALDKLEEIQNWDGETKIRESVNLATTTTEKKMQGKIDDLVAKQTKIVTDLQSELNNSQSQLQDAIVVTKIVEAVNKEGGDVTLLMPHVRSQVRMVKDNNGKFKPEVIKPDGTLRVGDNSGNDMTIQQLVQEMKTQDTFAAAFPGANKTGSGRDGTNNDNRHSGKDGKKVKVIPASDTKTMNNNLEGIASGEVVVDMDK